MCDTWHPRDPDVTMFLLCRYGVLFPLRSSGFAWPCRYVVMSLVWTRTNSPTTLIHFLTWLRNSYIKMHAITVCHGFLIFEIYRSRSILRFSRIHEIKAVNAILLTLKVLTYSALVKTPQVSRKCLKTTTKIWLEVVIFFPEFIMHVACRYSRPPSLPKKGGCIRRLSYT